MLVFSQKYACRIESGYDFTNEASEENYPPAVCCTLSTHPVCHSPGYFIIYL